MAFKTLPEPDPVPLESYPGDLLLYQVVERSQRMEVHNSASLDYVDYGCISVKLGSTSGLDCSVGTWCTQEKSISSNLRELTAIRVVLLHFAPQLNGKQ